MNRMLVLCLLVTLVAPSLITAQDLLGGDVTPAGAGRPSDDKGWNFQFNGSSTFVVGGEIDGDSDEIDVLINSLDLSASRNLWRGARLGLGLTYEHRHYDIRGDNDFFARTEEPFEDVHTLGARVSLFQGLSRTWGLFFRAGIRGSAEAEADLADGISVNGILGIGHQFSDDFRAGLGVLVSRRFERGLLVVPGIQFDWKFAEDWRLQTRGLGAALIYTPCEAWTFSLRGRFENRRFRLADDEDTEDGIFRDRRIPVSLTATWRPEPAVAINLTAGVDVIRNFRVEDDDGDEIRNRDADPGAFFGLSVTISF